MSINSEVIDKVNQKKQKEKIMKELREQNGVVFNAKSLFELPEEVSLRMIGNIIKQIGHSDYVPFFSVKEVLDFILGEKDGAMTLDGCYIRKLQDRIFIDSENTD